MQFVIIIKFISHKKWLIMNNIDLYDKNTSKYFYDNRYAKNYMNEWPTAKKKRIIDVIQYLNLPKNGDCLDFGCGNGVITDILSKSLPLWNVYGCDISKNAIRNASKRFSRLSFFLNDDEKFINKKFDFIFSHHVLEHVYDVKDVSNQINERTKANASMLHIFPCGNPGSYEYNLCKLRIDGINTEMGNRFFFEDEGHIRRMTTEQCTKIFKPFNFILKQAYYSTQYYGAINWITLTNLHFILNMFNPTKSKDFLSRLKLMGMFVKFLIIFAIRRLTTFYDLVLNVNDKNIKHVLFLFLLKLPSKVSKYFDNYIKSLESNEWNTSKTQKNGSEMFLFFVRKD